MGTPASGTPGLRLRVLWTLGLFFLLCPSQRIPPPSLPTSSTFGSPGKGYLHSDPPAVPGRAIFSNGHSHQLSSRRSCGVGVDAARTEATRFLALLGMRMGGWGCSWFPLQCPPGRRFRAAHSSSGREACFPGAKRRAQQPAAAQARPPRAPGGLCRGGSSRAPLPASQRGWHRSGGSAGGSDPGAGRWAALAAAGQAVRGAALEAAPLAAGEASGRRNGAAELGR